MKPDELLRIVEQIHLERHIDVETIFGVVEQALALSARKRGEGLDDSDVDIHIDRSTGEIYAYRGGIPIPADEITERIGAQTAKQVLIQKIHDVSRDLVYEKYLPLVCHLVTGEVIRNERAVTLVRLPDVEAIIPNSNKIPYERFRQESRVTALVDEVRKAGSKVKVVLSRTKPLFVQRLFEREIPEIADGTIEIVSVKRMPGKRSKVAVRSRDPRIDLVGACVGVRGARSRAITDELGGERYGGRQFGDRIDGERIDVVPYSEDPDEYIKAALKPAIVEEVILCDMLGRAIVLVQDEQRKYAIGLGGQNVRLASKLCEIDIEIMTRKDLDKMLDDATEAFTSIEGVSEDLANALVEQGFLSFDDLSVIELDDLVALAGGELTEEQALKITDRAEELALELERQEKERRESERGQNGDSNKPSPEDGEQPKE